MLNRIVKEYAPSVVAWQLPGGVLFLSVIAGAASLAAIPHFQQDRDVFVALGALVLAGLLTLAGGIVASVDAARHKQWGWVGVLVGGAALFTIVLALSLGGLSWQLGYLVVLMLAPHTGLLSLAEALIISCFILIPQQPLVALGIEVGVVGLICWIVISGATFLQIARSHQEGFDEARTWYGMAGLILASQVITLPFVIAGILLLLRMEGGVYWLAPGMLSVLPYAIFMGWVLTVEINR